MAEQLLERARAEGVSLVGPGGLLSGVTKTVLETALDAELTDHLGYEPHERVGADNSRNGYRAKTVLTDVARWRSTCRGTGPAVRAEAGPQAAASPHRGR